MYILLLTSLGEAVNCARAAVKRAGMLLLAGMLLSGCQGILDKEPIAIFDAASFFQTEADAVQGINAAYRPLLFNNRNGNFYLSTEG